MFAALGMGAFESGMFHVVTHAFFKALLFLGAGSVIHAMSGEQDIRNMGGLSKYIKITWATFLIGTLAISGIFPFSGFFSKDEILANAYNGHTLVWILLSISSMLTAFYMFRLFFLTFSRDFRGTAQQQSHLHESPWTMTVPLVVLSVFAVIAGFWGLPAVLSENHLFVRPMMVLSDLFYVLVDKLIVDLLVMARAWIIGFTGRTIRLVQTGNTGLYLFLMVIGMMVFMLIQLVY